MREIKDRVIQIFAGFVVIAIIMALYFFSWKTGGDLTTSSSCTTSFIKGEVDIKTLREECPNLSKDQVIEAVNEYYNRKYTFSAHASRDQMVQEINQGF